jgi:hypothetical protein
LNYEKCADHFVQPDVPLGTDGGNDRADRVRQPARASLRSCMQNAVLRRQPDFRSAIAGHGSGSGQFAAANFDSSSGGGGFGFGHRRDIRYFPGSRNFFTCG